MEYIFNSNEIQVESTRVVRVGSICNIHSSMAYMSIDEGKIKVISLKGAIELDDMEEDMRVWVDSLMYEEEYEPGMCLDHTTMKQIQEVLDTPWVQYEYVHNGAVGGADSNTYWMPVQTFLEHTTIY